MLHALAIPLHHLPIDHLFNVLELRVRVGSIALRPILYHKHDLARAVNTHREASAFHRVEILIIAEALENLRCCVDSTLLNPLFEPVEEAAQANLLLVVARKL